MHRTLKTTLILATAAMGLLTHSANAAMVVRYTFDEGSGTVLNTGGTAGSAGNLTIQPAATYSSSGQGVSGATGDYAFQGTSGQNAANNSVAQTAADLSGLDNLGALTITGWLNVANTNAFTNDSNIVNNQSGFGSGFLLRTNPGGQLKLFINNFSASVSDSAGGAYDNDLNSWVFFAVTFDGAIDDSLGVAVKFYQGTTAAASTLVSDVNRNATNTGNNSGPLNIGNQASGSIGTGFNGMLDDIRIYDTALDSTAIEAIRQSALIPEPSALSLGIIAFGAAVLRRRARSK